MRKVNQLDGIFKTINRLINR